MGLMKWCQIEMNKSTYMSVSTCLLSNHGNYFEQGGPAMILHNRNHLEAQYFNPPVRRFSSVLHRLENCTRITPLRNNTTQT